jgi:serine/threonine protein kinase
MAPLLPCVACALALLACAMQQLGEELGRGSSGKVFRALNRESGQFCAIKEIPTRNMARGHLEAVQSEIDLLHYLQHEQIVRYFETIRTEGHLYLVLEYVENGSLATIIKNFGAFPEHLVCKYICQVLCGLEWLHGQGVCHRDIKGANLLITKEGQVKLADFGVARKLTDSSEQPSAASVAGTPYWMAPEVVEMSSFTTASDIWSLGCTIVELLTAEPPYYDLKPIPALYRIVQDAQPPLPSDLSPESRAFLGMCFTRDPKQRPSASQLRAHPWLARVTAAVDSKLRPDSAQRIGQLAVVQAVVTRPPRVSREEGDDNTTGSELSQEQPISASGTGSREGSRDQSQSHTHLRQQKELQMGGDMTGTGTGTGGSASLSSTSSRSSESRSRCGYRSGGGPRAPGPAPASEPRHGCGLVLPRHEFDLAGSSGHGGAAIAHTTAVASTGIAASGQVQMVTTERTGASPVLSASSATSPRRCPPGMAEAAIVVEQSPSQQQPPVHTSERDQPSGLLWKRGSSKWSFAYHQRYFFFAHDALCYRRSEEDVPLSGEKRIPLAAIKCARVHSALKNEFVVCTSRSTHRLRAPSAEALTTWLEALQRST